MAETAQTSLNFTVRRAGVADVDFDGLAAIWLEAADALAKADSRYRVASDGKAQWVAALKDWLARPDYALFVADRGGKHIGYAVGAVVANLPGFVPERHGLVTEIAIDFHAKTGRIGRELFDAMCGWFRAEGVDRVEARVPYRHVVAQAFWRAIGATKIHEQMWLRLK